MVNVVIFASGHGSNFQCLVDAKLDINIKLLVCNKKDAYVITRAKQANIDVLIVDYLNNSNDEVEQVIINRLNTLNIDYLLLAGYMKILSPLIINTYPNTIINIHPSLLPKYPGLDAVNQALVNNEDKLGITIHYVDELVDHGKIIIQDEFSIINMSEQMIYKRLHELEHRLYIEAIKMILEEVK